VNYLTQTNGVRDDVKCAGLVEKISEFINGLTTRAVLGVSGGADSTLMCCLCVKALGADRVHTYSMPYNDIDKATFNSRSESMAKFIGVHHHEVPIKSIVDSVMTVITEDGLDTSHWLINGNARARSRMIVLYAKCAAVANTTGEVVRVMGTDNKVENFLGYFSIFGDGGVDNNPIEDLYKREVYDLLDYFAAVGMIEDDHIDRTPSAGLTDGHTDEGELGFTYDDMAEEIEYLNAHSPRHNDDTTSSMTPIRKFVWERHKATAFKRSMPVMIHLR